MEEMAPHPFAGKNTFHAADRMVVTVAVGEQSICGRNQI
jgi:hypothetical protein